MYAYNQTGVPSTGYYPPPQPALGPAQHSTLSYNAPPNYTRPASAIPPHQQYPGSSPYITTAQGLVQSAYGATGIGVQQYQPPQPRPPPQASAGYMLAPPVQQPVQQYSTMQQSVAAPRPPAPVNCIKNPATTSAPTVHRQPAQYHSSSVPVIRQAQSAYAGHDYVDNKPSPSKRYSTVESDTSNRMNDEIRTLAGDIKNLHNNYQNLKSELDTTNRDLSDTKSENFNLKKKLNDILSATKTLNVPSLDKVTPMPISESNKQPLVASNNKPDPMRVINRTDTMNYTIAQSEKEAQYINANSAKMNAPVSRSSGNGNLSYSSGAYIH